MNRAKSAPLFSASLSFVAFSAVFALATACASGGEDPDDNDNNGGSAGSSNNTSGSSNNTSGSSNNTSGSTSGGSGGSEGATGGSGGSGGGQSAPSVCDDATFELPLEEAYIDNFETEVRFGGWYAFSDTTPPNEPSPMRMAGGALDTGYSGHVGATGIKASTMMGYGAGFGFGLVDPAKGACVDLSAFDGISFWAKGTAGTTNVLKFQIVAPATQPTDSEPVGDCATTACRFKHPAKEITLSETWQQFTIKWTDLAPAAAFTGKVLGFNMITDGPDYSVDIDEVTFFSGTAPTTPVEPPAAM